MILRGQVASVLLAPVLCFSQDFVDRTTRVTPEPDEDILQSCEYRLTLPDTREPVRAAWVIFERGPDTTAFYQNPQVRAFAATRRLALILAMHCRSKQIEDMNVDPAKGIGRTLFTALNQFASSEFHPELKSVPLIAMGWSGAGSLVGRLAGFRPERYLAGIAYEPGQYDPLGMNTIQLDREAIRKPQLIIAGGADDHVGTERPYRYFRKYFDQGAPWTFAIQNRTPHCCLLEAQSLILDWLNDVLIVDRERARQFGYITVEPSELLDGWKNPVVNATAARVGDKRCQPKGKELCAGWLHGWDRPLKQQWPKVRPHVQLVVAAVNAATPGTYVEVEIPASM